MDTHFERRALQITIGVACIVPLAAGLLGIAQGASMLGGASDVSLDSHIRYLSGLLLGVGLGFASTIPNIERKGARFATLGTCVLIGGLARLYGMLSDGWPAVSMMFALSMELGVTPILWIWQRRVANEFRGHELE